MSNHVTPPTPDKIDDEAGDDNATPSTPDRIEDDNDNDDLMQEEQNDKKDDSGLQVLDDNVLLSHFFTPSSPSNDDARLQLTASQQQLIVDFGQLMDELYGDY